MLFFTDDNLPPIFNDGRDGSDGRCGLFMSLIFLPTSEKASEIVLRTFPNRFRILSENDFLFPSGSFFCVISSVASPLPSFPPVFVSFSVFLFITPFIIVLGLRFLKLSIPVEIFFLILSSLLVAVPGKEVILFLSELTSLLIPEPIDDIPELKASSASR